MLVRNLALRIVIRRDEELRARLNKCVFQQTSVTITQHFSGGSPLDVSVHEIEDPTAVDHDIFPRHFLLLFPGRLGHAQKGSNIATSTGSLEQNTLCYHG